MTSFLLDTHTPYFCVLVNTISVGERANKIQSPTELNISRCGQNWDIGNYITAAFTFNFGYSLDS
jgi:hypothetical protein